MVGLAMILYPGGNPKNVSANNFHLLFNNICELRRETAINGLPNLVSKSLYESSVIFFSTSLIFFFAILWIPFYKKKVTRILSIIGSIFGVFQGAFYNIVAFTGGKIHITFLIVTQLAEIFGIIFYTIVMMLDKRILKINSYSFLFISVFAFTFLMVIIATIFVGGDFLFVTHRGGHTIYHFVLLTVYSMQAFGMFLFLKRSNSS